MRIVEDDLTGEKIVALLRSHFENMLTITPPGSAHVLDLEKLRSPDITFWSAWEGTELLGCGALKALDDTSGEVKSMRTVKAHRRKGVASQILKRIVAIAQQRGYIHLNLETGAFPAFDPARAFYERHGFEYRGPFADYTPDPNSAFMTKRLDES